MTPSVLNRPANQVDGDNAAWIRKLEARASARYAWHYEPVMAAGKRRLFASATCPDDLLVAATKRQEAGEQGVEEPFWATVWQAAVGLDWFIETLDLPGCQVLELGAGTGRAGLAAALRGAEVTITDGMTDPLLLAQLSTWDLPNCHVRRLRWGEEQLDRKFSMILGSDVTYNRKFWTELEVAMRQHLEPGGVILFSDPCRLIANEFRDWIGPRGWSYSESHVPHCQDAHRSIRIMQLRLA
ncbi:Putative methyltransferase [Rosistilla ulvae]|uniref:Methyltransferase n=1 Tax=Rosistilla ulvae TaxID=1930277 RepID=A0A517LXV5_9BACT|nr:protein N-lysine methyltransferase family protein [Rosistilla ulvae]QDS87461.1 Putative methyltransferase [Rosistilla ulvae]